MSDVGNGQIAIPSALLHLGSLVCCFLAPAALGFIGASVVSVILCSSLGLWMSIKANEEWRDSYLNQITDEITLKVIIAAYVYGFTKDVVNAFLFSSLSYIGGMVLQNEFGSILS